MGPVHGNTVLHSLLRWLHLRHGDAAPQQYYHDLTQRVAAIVSVGLELAEGRQELKLTSSSSSAVTRSLPAVVKRIKRWLAPFEV